MMYDLQYEIYEDSDDGKDSIFDTSSQQLVQSMDGASKHSLMAQEMLRDIARIAQAQAISSVKTAASPESDRGTSCDFVTGMLFLTLKADVQFMYVW